MAETSSGFIIARSVSLEVGVGFFDQLEVSLVRWTT
jgi:hypothetical protein